MESYFFEFSSVMVVWLTEIRNQHDLEYRKMIIPFMKKIIFEQRKIIPCTKNMLIILNKCQLLTFNAIVIL